MWMDDREREEGTHKVIYKSLLFFATRVNDLNRMKPFDNDDGYNILDN